MATKTYRLRIAYDGREFEAEGDEAFISEMLKLHGPPPSAPIGPSDKKKQKGTHDSGGPARPTSGKLVSIREFVQQLDLKKHTDITLAFGYFLEKHQGATEFTPADINNCYYEAKLEASNTSQMIIQNIKRGYFMASKGKGKGRYTLTLSGEKFIEVKGQGNS